MKISVAENKMAVKVLKRNKQITALNVTLQHMKKNKQLSSCLVGVSVRVTVSKVDGRYETS